MEKSQFPCLMFQSTKVLSYKRILIPLPHLNSNLNAWIKRIAQNLFTSKLIFFSILRSPFSFVDFSLVQDSAVSYLSVPNSDRSDAILNKTIEYFLNI